MQAVLYVVATPIGHLGDLGERARTVLGEVSLVAAEDTRHSAKLLRHYGIDVPMLSLHEHNEADRVPQLLAMLERGDSIALISDAGTPLVSDPGFRLVRAASDAGYAISPVPGPCAAIAAISVSGLATDRFWFEGFLPVRGGRRRRRLQEMADLPATLVLYVAPHRLQAELDDLAAALGGDRKAVVARELTKLHESVYRGTLAALAELAHEDRSMRRGELVVIVEGAGQPPEPSEKDLLNTLRVLLAHLSARDAATVCSKLTGCRRKLAYKLASGLADEVAGDNGS